jgi:hypothetical protein
MNTIFEEKDLSKRYYVFAHKEYDCGGGLYDLDITTNNFEEAKKYAESRKKSMCSWDGVEIFDRIEGKVHIVESNEKGEIINE